MPFRAKVKKAFGKNEDPSGAGSDIITQSKPSTKRSKKPKIEYPANVYQPGEIPESKYKGPYNKDHQQKLHAFSFKTAFQGRRKSEQSLYSPMGSRLPSRMGSFMSRRSFARSRQQSRVEDTLMENNEADDAVENVGMSHQHTTEEAPRPRTREEGARLVTKASLAADGLVSSATGGNQMTNSMGNGNIKGMNGANEYGQPMDTSNSNRTHGLEPTKTQIQGGSFGQPFSADDLVRAMTQSTLKPTAVQA
ncbi:MAG: hypothetical protein Q9166_007336 [cf. Caloplaca sp. 2 TL-2023]